MLQSLPKFGNKTADPQIVTTTPKTTSPTAGSFSRLNNECGSSCIKIKPGKIYDSGIAASSPLRIKKKIETLMNRF